MSKCTAAQGHYCACFICAELRADSKAAFDAIKSGHGIKVEPVECVEVAQASDPICLHNRSDKHSITIMLTDGTQVEIPPLHAADVTQRFSRFATAVVLTPMDIVKRYGPE